MQKLVTFSNPEFGNVRGLTIHGEPWLVGKDVAITLGYKNPRDALANHVDSEDKGVANCDTLGGTQEMTVINESGLYSLILGSKLPGAKKFKRWVTSDVLPSIRKTGGYIAGQESMTDQELMAKALMVAQKTIEERNRQIEMMKPKEIFADAVATSHTSILVGELAKILKGNGIEIGQNRLFAELRNRGYLIRREGTDHNMPTQKAMELNLFEIKETAVSHSDGHVTIQKTPKVTGKGQQYFINMFLKEYGCV